MKDTTSGAFIGVAKLTPKQLPVPKGYYRAWKCSECVVLIAVFDDLSRGLVPLRKFEPLDAHVRLKCPHCTAERLYGINDHVSLRID
jgi:hypothetical protein